MTLMAQSYCAPLMGSTNDRTFRIKVGENARTQPGGWSLSHPEIEAVKLDIGVSSDKVGGKALTLFVADKLIFKSLTFGR